MLDLGDRPSETVRNTTGADGAIFQAGPTTEGLWAAVQVVGRSRSAHCRTGNRFQGRELLQSFHCHVLAFAFVEHGVFFPPAILPRKSPLLPQFGGVLLFHFSNASVSTKSLPCLVKNVLSYPNSLFTYRFRDRRLNPGFSRCPFWELQRVKPEGF